MNALRLQLHDMLCKQTTRRRQDFPKLQNCNSTCHAFCGPTKGCHEELEAKVTQFVRVKLNQVHPTEIRTSIYPSSAVELNTTSALANYATKAGSNT
ncbi:unnamed protein product [Timema podura]|uniref:Uncharacterized protein n=1 Tax=Timema podura TaxID=61482 RepID=A0ABN7P0F3_TIMPD|nr:unnamed protein product [Timema podura]